MNVIMTIAVETPLEKPQVIEIAKVVNRIFNQTVIGGKGKKIATQSSKDGVHFYDFEFDVDGSEEQCDLIANELYNTLSFDFSMEIDCEVNEDYLHGCNADDDEGKLLIEDEPSVIHAKWLSQRIKEGWKFGTEFSEDVKTDPLMRPYHALSARQQAIALNNHNH